MISRVQLQTPNSSLKSSSAMEDDSFYFIRCRRDANCKCKICQASINATLDLQPTSAQRSSLTKQPSPPETPLFFDPSVVSTPKSETSSRLVVETDPSSNPMVTWTDCRMKVNRKKTELVYGLMALKFVLVVWLILVAKLGFSFVTSTVMKTELSAETVRSLSEKSLGIQDVKERLGFLKSELRNVVGAGVSASSKWEIVQDGSILRFHHQLYKTGIEEVSVWGWPLQTAGLLTTDFSSRSFTILSGRVTEWSNGDLGRTIREANTSWKQEKWSSSLWRLDENTWILEYKRSFVFENRTPFSSSMDFFKFKMMNSLQWMKQLWEFSDGNHLTPT